VPPNYESFNMQPEKLTVDAFGEPGNRVFLLQATMGSQTVTLKVAKEQLRALARYIGDLLEDLPRPAHLPADEDLAMSHPAEPQWDVGPISVTYEQENDQLVMTCEQATSDGSSADLDMPAAVATFRVSREQIAALAIRAIQLVEAGRPPCPLCGYPLDARGHTCPRTNGNSQPLV
jgi:uncharacterized repeat protein (TIGR03847 family)